MWNDGSMYSHRNMQYTYTTRVEQPPQQALGDQVTDFVDVVLLVLSLRVCGYSTIGHGFPTVGFWRANEYS
jgi:hypothetical protein